MPRSIIPPLIQVEATTMKELKCQKCDYKWYPNKPDTLPKVCPRCKSFNWNGPYKKPK